MRLQSAKRLLIGGLCGVFLVSAAATSAQGDVYEIDQIMDMSALAPEDFYRFVPNYYWIKSGDTVRFLNSTGNHTVKTIKGIWPEGALPVDIEHQETYDVQLTVPGVYGFRCKVHSRHGMFALVVVDTPEPNLAKARGAKLGDRAREVFDELFQKLEKDREARGK